MTPIKALFGLFLCPYFLWFSTLYYTDIIAIFFVLLGVSFYLRHRALSSGLSFILAIASRQYMLAFPLAISAYELFNAVKKRRQLNTSFFSSSVAASTILVWLLIFNGFAPAAAFEHRSVPPVQQDLQSLNPEQLLQFWNISAFLDRLAIDSSLYFLACIGFFYVLPECFLFPQKFRKQPFCRSKAVIAAILLFLLIVFTPTNCKGVVWEIAQAMPVKQLANVLFYGLALLTCWRFYSVNLTFWMVLFNAGIMLKAFPWDKYALPLIVILWFLKAKEPAHIVEIRPEQSQSNSSAEQLVSQS
ncbi:hypothetical protein PN498_08640 [Oscillatoria sp. CS-180]|uniref:hypothetical protein n=1 Tax=Oscillatoria sp. CS-180 TaxID=3021720 RepID=UPI00232B6563|nr:hypothetical protein [Oscillatoria sp. CS-180]MDB9526051.1 hypothetical protein [Oscillatoria sp. CS-180]